MALRQENAQLKERLAKAEETIVATLVDIEHD